jgi:hypothetical protein
MSAPRSRSSTTPSPRRASVSCERWASSTRLPSASSSTAPEPLPVRTVSPRASASPAATATTAPPSSAWSSPSIARTRAQVVGSVDAEPARRGARRRSRAGRRGRRRPPSARPRAASRRLPAGGGRACCRCACGGAREGAAAATGLGQRAPARHALAGVVLEQDAARLAERGGQVRRNQPAEPFATADAVVVAVVGGAADALGGRAQSGRGAVRRRTLPGHALIRRIELRSQPPLDALTSGGDHLRIQRLVARGGHRTVEELFGMRAMRAHRTTPSGKGGELFAEPRAGAVQQDGDEPLGDPQEHGDLAIRPAPRSSAGRRSRRRAATGARSPAADGRAARGSAARAPDPAPWRPRSRGRWTARAAPSPRAGASAPRRSPRSLQRRR